MQNLSAETLARLAGVRLRARAVVEGVLSGLHKSPHQGQSVEFSEHKEYAPGDELRHLDWKAYGKFDRHYIKRFEHETHLKAFLVLDGSASMGYRSGALSKLEAAATLAGALSYLLVRQQDAAGLTWLSGSRARHLPPRAAASHLRAIWTELDGAIASGTTDLKSAADHLSERVTHRSLIVIFTDLLDDDLDGALDRLLQLRRRGSDLTLFHLVDRAELTFPFDDPTLFLSMEDDRKVEVNAREIRESYLEEFDGFLAQTQARCAEANVDYQRVLTDEPLDAVLLRYLARRQGRRR